MKNTEKFPAAMQMSSLSAAGNIKKFSLNLVEKWRKIREAELYARNKNFRRKLHGDYYA